MPLSSCNFCTLFAVVDTDPNCDIYPATLLLDLSSNALSSFYISWRPAIKGVLKLPANTHANVSYMDQVASALLKSIYIVEQSTLFLNISIPIVSQFYHSTCHCVRYLSVSNRPKFRLLL